MNDGIIDIEIPKLTKNVKINVEELKVNMFFVINVIVLFNRLENVLQC